MSLTNYLTQLVIPINFSIVLLLAATLFLILKRRRQALILSAVAIIWVFFWSLPVSSIWLGGHLENRYPYQNAEHLPVADAIVVLGGHTANNRKNWFEPYHPNNTTTRISHGAQLYTAQRAPVVLVSGAALDGGRSEAQAMALYLQKAGIPSHHLLVEENSYTTRENATYSAKLLKQQQLSRILLVTSALHMVRAAASFEKQGIEVIAAPVAPQITRPQHSWLAIWKPSYRSLHASRSIIKEYLGLLVYWLRGWV